MADLTRAKFEQTMADLIVAEDPSIGAADALVQAKAMLADALDHFGIAYDEGGLGFARNEATARYIVHQHRPPSPGF